MNNTLLARPRALLVLTSAAALLLSACGTSPSGSNPVTAAVGQVATAMGVAPAAGAPAPAPSASYGPDGCKYLPQTAPPTTDMQNAAIGAVGGAAIGAGIGASSARTASVGARNGALIGAVAGALIGSQFNNVVGVTQQTDGSVKLDIPGKVLFRSGSAEISPEFQAELGKVGGTIREWCGVTAVVVGHTDSTGSAAANVALSKRRATSVVSALVAQGVPSNRLSTDGKGESELKISPEVSDADRAENRRVEIFVKPPM